MSVRVVFSTRVGTCTVCANCIMTDFVTLALCFEFKFPSIPLMDGITCNPQLRYNALRLVTVTSHSEDRKL